MIRVLIVREDYRLADEIREFLDRQLDFQVIADIPLDATSMEAARRWLPDVTILIVLNSHGLSFAGTFKMELPDLPLFLVSRDATLESERVAISHRVDAVFLAGDELTSLALNARELCS